MSVQPLVISGPAPEKVNAISRPISPNTAPSRAPIPPGGLGIACQSTLSDPPAELQAKEQAEEDAHRE